MRNIDDISCIYIYALIFTLQNGHKLYYILSNGIYSITWSMLQKKTLQEMGQISFDILTDVKFDQIHTYSFGVGLYFVAKFFLLQFELEYLNEY